MMGASVAEDDETWWIFWIHTEGTAEEPATAAAAVTTRERERNILSYGSD